MYGIFESVEFLNEGLFGLGKKKEQPKYELNSPERKEIIRKLKASIKSLPKIKGLSFYDNFDAEQFIDGYDDLLCFASFEIAEADSTNNKVMGPIQNIETQFNKEYKNYNVYIDWDKYEGTYFLKAK